MNARVDDLRVRLQGLGFDVVHFASLAAQPEQRLAEWLAAGHQADMAWMERTAERRLNPEQVLPGARSIIVLGVNYWRRAPEKPSAEVRGTWARYACHADYHDTIRPALAAAGRILEESWGLGPEDYRYYVDTGPVLERGWAERAGVGFTGKNAMLISREFGNWLLLSAVLMRAELPADGRGGRTGKSSRLCGTCQRCLEACPTAAFPEPGVLDSRRCISYQTIENRGMIPRELRPGIGRRIFGCDVCLEVCPWNRFAREGRAVLLTVRDDLAELSLREILRLTPESFARVFRGTAVKRLKLRGLLRNACIAAGNSGDATLFEEVMALTAHAEPLVRAHAVWAAHRLHGPAAAERLRAGREGETDPDVLAEYAAAGIAQASAS